MYIAYQARINAPDQVAKWQRCLGQPLISHHSHPKITELWTVRLECLMLPLCEAEQPKAHLETLATATIDIRLRQDGVEPTLELSFTGQLAAECTCWLRRQARSVVTHFGQPNTRNCLIAILARFAEERWSANWVSVNRCAACPICEVCGKICGGGGGIRDDDSDLWPETLNEREH